MPKTPKSGLVANDACAAERHANASAKIASAASAISSIFASCRRYFIGALTLELSGGEAVRLNEKLDGRDTVHLGELMARKSA